MIHTKEIVRNNQIINTASDGSFTIMIYPDGNVWILEITVKVLWFTLVSKKFILNNVFKKINWEKGKF